MDANIVESKYWCILQIATPFFKSTHICVYKMVLIYLWAITNDHFVICDHKAYN